MPGPLPKDPALRQRRNKSASRAMIVTDAAPIAAAPKLPARPNGKWNPMTQTWWADIWSSPLHHEYLRADLGALFRLVFLVDQFWDGHSLEVAKEIRMLEREFGLTPLSRRRLEWTVVQTDEAKDKSELKRARGGRVIERDPRDVLK